MNLQGTTRSEYDAQGKSNNFLAAEAAGHLTAGQAAKLLSKRLGRKILAKQLEPLAGEFHHAGRFGKRQAKRVFFFTEAELQHITLADIEQASAPVWGWVLGFRKHTGRRHTTRYSPIVAEVGQIPADKARRLGDKFHPLTEEEASEAQAAVGKTLPAYSHDWKEAT